MKRLILSLALLVSLGTPALAGNAVNNPPSSGGGAGSISTITSSGGTITIVSPSGPTTNLEVSALGGGGITTLTGDVTAGPGSGSQAATIATASVTLAKMADIATSRFIGRITAGTGVPEALTAANAWTILGVQPAANFPALTGDLTTVAGAVATTLATVNSNVGSFTYGSFTVNAKGLVTAASSGAAPEVPLTFSTGLTRTTNTITDNLATGVAGGQTAIGGTASGNSLTLSSTSNATKGKFIFGSTTGMQYDEANAILSVGIATPDANSTMHVKKSVNGASNAYVQNPNTGGATTSNLSVGTTDDRTGVVGYMSLLGTNYTNSGNLIANSLLVQLITGAGNFIFRDFGTGAFVFQNTASDTERMRISTTGVLTHMNTPFASFTSASSLRAQANGEVMAFAQVPPTQTTGASIAWNAYRYDSTTTTVTGATGVTTATGFNFIDVEAQTITDSSAANFTNVSTMAIKGAVTMAGSATATNNYAFWVQGGTVRYDGRVQWATGASVASGGTTTLGTDGNVFPITGTTTIDYITTTGWRSGAIVFLTFGSALTVDHNTGSVPGGTASILLAGAANYSAAAGSKLVLYYNGTNWIEISRST